MRADRLVQPLGVEVGIGQEHLDPGPAHRLAERPAELHQVGRRPPPRDRREDQVAGAIDHEDDLRVVRISPVAVGIPVRLPLGEVGLVQSRVTLA